MRPLVLLVVTVLATVSCASDVNDSPSDGEGTIGSWSVSSGFDSAGVATLADVELTTPADVPSVDILVEAEVNFATSGGDFGRVRAALYPEEKTDEGALQPITMLPKGGYDLGAAGLPPEEATLSASWHLEDVQADGSSYRVELFGVAIDGDGDFRAEIRGDGNWARVQIRP